MFMHTDDQIFLKINKGRELYNRLTNNGTTAITEEQALADIPRFLLCFGPVPRLNNAACRKLQNLGTVGIIPLLL